MKQVLIRVLCVEDNDLVADAIGRKLTDDPRFTWLGWVGSLAALRDKVKLAPPDVVVLDQHIPGEDAFEMIGMLKRETPAVRAMILTGHADLQNFEKAMDAGVWGYVSKTEDSRFIINAICRVGHGECVFDAYLLAAHKSRTTTPDPAPGREPRVRSRGIFGIFGPNAKQD